VIVIWLSTRLCQNQGRDGHTSPWQSPSDPRSQVKESRSDRTHEWNQINSVA
jgi:hypothetical protein